MVESYSVQPLAVQFSEYSSQFLSVAVHVNSTEVSHETVEGRRV